VEILPSLLGFIDAKINTFKKRIVDAAENPSQVAEQLVDNTISFKDSPWFTDPKVREQYNNDPQAYLKDNPTGNRTEVGGVAGEQIKDPGNFIGGGAGTFISRGAKSWSQPRYIEAVKLKVKGVSNDEIWAKTGTWLNPPDMIPRQEISDLGMTLRNPRGWKPSTIVPGAEYQQGQLDQLTMHPELTKAYPELLKDAFSKISKKAGDDKKGIFDEARPAVYAHAHDDDDVLKVLAHEIQHYVQSKENFARGGNPSAVLKGDIPEADAFFQAWRDKLIKAGHDPAKATDKAAYEAYHNLAGEAEARATASRIYLNDEERRALPPWKTLMGDISIPYNKLIVRFGGGKSAK